MVIVRTPRRSAVSVTKTARGPAHPKGEGGVGRRRWSKTSAHASRERHCPGQKRPRDSPGCLGYTWPALSGRQRHPVDWNHWWSSPALALSRVVSACGLQPRFPNAVEAGHVWCVQGHIHTLSPTISCPTLCAEQQCRQKRWFEREIDVLEYSF